jgi:4'-phosphopantetheinyl transferase
MSEPGESAPSLGAESVHVWSVPDDVDRRDLLAADELERADRLRHDGDRRRFVARRAGLRQVLAAYTGAQPEALVFERWCQRCGHPAHGRPRLSTAANLSFSTASRPGIAVVAVAARPMSIGVDVEVTAGFDHDAVRRTALTPDELIQVDSTGSPTDVQLWCRKEAAFKAQGIGFVGSSPASFDVRGPMAAGWHLTDLPPTNGWVGAVATAQPVVELRVARWVAGVSQGRLEARRGRAR